MESLLEQLNDLKIKNEQKIGKKFEDNLKTTGLICANSTGCFLEHEKNIFSRLKSIPKRLNNTDDDIIENSLGLISDVLNGKLENGVVFIDKIKSNNQNTVSSITEKSIAMHSLKRVLILDLNNDITNLEVQNRFYSDSKVLYCSIHNFINGITLPEKNFDFIGNEAGKGFNINISLNQGLHGDSEYISIFFNILLPIAYEFNPELILIPLGFEDTQLSSSIFAHFIHFLSCLANGKIALLVDNTISTDNFKECIIECTRSLLGYPCKRLKALNEPISESIMNSISVLRPFWCCLQLLNEHDSIDLNEFVENYKNNLTTEPRKSIDIFRQIFKEKSEPNSKNNISLDSRTCICSDLEMMKHYNLLQSEHPERPDRIKRIIETLKDKSLYDRCQEVKSRYALEKEVELCHDSSYIDSIKEVRDKTIDELKELSKNPHSVYFHSSTFDCALLATGSLLQVVDQVCENKCLNGVGVIRPPGHHAYGDSCSGFCFFNSIAVAARYAQKNFDHIKKVLILDFDIHHGNGTQDIFLEDDSVLFISLHRYDNGSFYPVDADSNYDEVGRGKGKGFNINIPWNQQTAGDAEYVAAFLRIVMPVAYQFNPDLVLVSAGFDGATGDPLGRYNITPDGFAQMTKMLCSLADGHVILGLEGGYNLTSISESMASCVSILLGDRCPSIRPINAKPKAYESIRNVIKTQKEFWSCFKFDGKVPNCEFQKNFRSENKVKKPVAITEKTYTLRSRNKTKTEDTKNENSNKENSVEKKELKSKPIKSNLPELPVLAEDSTDFSEISTAFSVIPLPYCPHLEEINKNLDPKLIDVHRPCAKCNSFKENWICLSCFECGCSRFVKEHMVEHYDMTKHPMALSFSDLSVWCYVCDSYVHNSLLTEVKQMAYTSKFG